MSLSKSRTEITDPLKCHLNLGFIPYGDCTELVTDLKSDTIDAVIPGRWTEHMGLAHTQMRHRYAHMRLDGRT